MDITELRAKTTVIDPRGRGRVLGISGSTAA